MEVEGYLVCVRREEGILGSCLLHLVSLEYGSFGVDGGEKGCFISCAWGKGNQLLLGCAMTSGFLKSC